MKELVSSQWVMINCVRHGLWMVGLTALIMTPVWATVPLDPSPPVGTAGEGEFKNPDRSGLENTPDGGTLPGGTVPGGTLQGGTLPGGTVPGGSVPGGTVPGGTLPDETLPGGPLPGGTLPGGTVPSENLPGEDP